ncbi:hypothetical protein EJ05DRAFT_60951 [Pseudovirgaria hyperparasitica]|uniref:Uncharacterized protein n=1 Tax=Pseudovirgaria hyperparasitica TaxID=470096 RepID=A0A6A6W5P4_9PEZI|nr:uncharacterized protein EJ05DRAFT_60951 [Pseudovirgaria hyperparasitica]KAF2757260.1 hypothetical protein EJ05DRAFT_60951 [Pseudovirgaria hyperparasitica]
MPLNFSNKVFPRRKSSGNVLDEVQRPTSDGFRVMSQVEVENKKQLQAAEKERRSRSGFFGTKPRQGSVEAEEDIRARNSSLYDNSSSSARFSSSSTLPSSSDKENSDNIFAPTKISDSRTFSLRGAGRTFTFGGKSSKLDSINAAKPSPPPLPHNIPLPNPQFRERSMTTTSYASTAQPPKIDYRIEQDTSEFGSGFDNLFEGLSSPRPALDKPLPPGPAQRTESEPVLALPPRVFTSTRPNAPPDPAEINAIRRDNNLSPRSWSSQDNLISSSLTDSPVEERAPPVPPHRDMNSPRMPPEAISPSSDRSDSPYRPVLSTSQQNSYLSLPTSYTRKDSTSSELSPKHSFSSISSQEEHTLTRAPVPVRNTAFSDGDESVASDATPRATSRRDADDDDLAASAAAAMSFAERPPANKVMNQAQYNSYRRQQEMRAPSVHSESDTEEDYNYDEEDEAERQREIAKQRRKQEAAMSVYRQRMSKMTGEKPMQAPSMIAEHPTAVKSDSVPTVTIGDEFSDELADTLGALDGTTPTRNGISGKSSSSGASGEESPDEDTPLGILMAHGFPSKTRPPTKMYGAGTPVVVPSDRPVSAGNPRASMMPGPGKIPPFARGLPREAPNYFGDGLVQPSNRESFALNNHAPASVYGGSMAGEQQRSTTLINVIANEERSKAMRRGSPNARNGFGPMMQSNQSMPNFQVSQNMQNLGNGMDMNGMMGMQGPGGNMDPSFQWNPQAFFQHMAMQQQQMFAMTQQMMAMGGMNGMNQPMTPMSGPNGMQNGYLNPSSTYAPSVAGRPMSMAPSISNRTSTMVGRPQSTFGLEPSARTQSMVRPPSTFNLGLNVPSSRQSTLMSGANPNYTPSIAPSERSTVGMASRYRPVNTCVNEGASVMSGQLSNHQLQHQQPGPASSDIHTRQKPGRGKAFLNAFKRNTRHEDIEEEDWSDVAQRKSRFLNPDRKHERDLKDLWPQDA